MNGTAPELKAIETEYKSHRFRSRCEARWAIFLDGLGINWEYEKEGFDLDGLWYLPDFWVPFWNAFIEVKGGQPSSDEIEKAVRLAKASQSDVYIVIGNPDPNRHRVLSIGKKGQLDPDMGLARFRQCKTCPEVFLVWVDHNDNEYAGGSVGHPDVAAYMEENPRHECLDKWPLMTGRVERAFQMACAARFEHGETPTV